MNRFLFVALLSFPVVAGVGLLAPSSSDEVAEPPETPLILHTDTAEPALPHCNIEADVRLVQPQLIAEPCNIDTFEKSFHPVAARAKGELS